MILWQRLCSSHCTTTQWLRCVWWVGMMHTVLISQPVMLFVAAPSPSHPFLSIKRFIDMPLSDSHIHVISNTLHTWPPLHILQIYTSGQTYTHNQIKNHKLRKLTYCVFGRYWFMYLRYWAKQKFLSYAQMLRCVWHLELIMMKKWSVRTDISDHDLKLMHRLERNLIHYREVCLHLCQSRTFIPVFMKINFTKKSQLILFELAIFKLCVSFVTQWILNLQK